MGFLVILKIEVTVLQRSKSNFYFRGHFQKRSHHLIKISRKIKIKTTTFFLICGNFLRSWIFLKINLTFTTELLFTTSGFIKITVTLFLITRQLFTFRCTFCQVFSISSASVFIFLGRPLLITFVGSFLKSTITPLFTQSSKS